MNTTDGDTYYINVTFQRSRSSDNDVICGGEGREATDAEFLAQFAQEMQSAYGLHVGMAGMFDMKSLNGAPITDEQAKAIMAAIDKECASW